MIEKSSIGVAVITYRDGKHLQYCLPALLNSPLKPRVLVVNSSSNDGTVEEASRLGAETLVIPRNEFNHGNTRERARKHLGTDIVVMMTPDAYPAGPDMLEKLVAPLQKGEASVTYARQIPHDGADIFETFPRKFNYPADSQVRSIDDAGKYGVYTFFSSDSCAAYLNQALDEIGGFLTTLTSEDYFAVAKLLQLGHRIGYVADAVVKHSHSYTLLQEFRRYFDTGYVRGENPWVQDIVGQAEERGKEYFDALIRELLATKPWIIPYAVINTLVKLLGYRVGFWSLNAPNWWKMMISGQPYYWDSVHYIRKFNKNGARN